ncbi:phenoloxidase-activating factor 2 [Manduca sexta]|nr:phenoloxidase-activating factor 2 [Manduca sexta]AAM69353.1 serine proteinase-like protein 2 [Manduca sexta]KAG6462285.1 hypothetical protein O3G_MSEX013166 [Manduca sexta]
MLLLLSLVAAAVAQQTTIDPRDFIGIFGTPPPLTNSTPGLETITVKPTDKPATFVNKHGEYCQCVPYYLCKDGLTINDPTLDGNGLLDIRFGEDENNDRLCQESVERCCKVLKDPSEVVKPKPDPSKLKGCGYRNPKGLGFTIVGNGGESQFGEFPWVVALLDVMNGSYAGVGVIIHPQVVMTGAHIASKYAPGKLRVRAGEWDTQTIKEELEHQERDVQEILIHKDFKPLSLKNDIALLRLQSPLELADHINSLCLPDQDESFDNSKNCVANGWGKNVFGVQGLYAVILKKVEQDMVPHSRCNTQLQKTRLGSHFSLHSSFVCAGGEEGKDTCQGDGGAPLACPIGNNRYKLSGLVAWGIGCGQKDVPAVYVNVPAFRHWVDENMNKWGYGSSTYSV